MIAPQKIANATSRPPSFARICVVLVALLWLVLASQLPYSLNGMGIVILLALAALDVVLGVTTGWLAFAPTPRLDERQAALRDRAYRVGFRLVGAGVLVMFLLYIAGNILQAIIASGQLRFPTDGFSARTTLAIVELLLIAPTAVVGWLLPPESESTDRRPGRWLPLAAVPAVALVWLIAILAAPVQSTTVATIPDNGFSMSDATCGHFSAVDRVAYGFGGGARLEAEVCWNRQQAFPVGDTNLPHPASLPAEEFARPFPGLTSCAPMATDTDFGTVVESCSVRIDPAGTFHLVLRAQVSPLPGGFLARDVEIRLVVTADGRVVRFN
jgi:hypothetical protein